MAEKTSSLLDRTKKEYEEQQRRTQLLNTFPKPQPPKNNTVYIEIPNHHTKGGYFPRFNPISKILSCHLHEELNIAGKS